MNIKEIIEKYYINNGNYKVSYDELREVIKEYMAIETLKKEYNEGNVNRKEIGQEILQRTKDLKWLMDIMISILQKRSIDYECPEYITDYHKVFELLLQLANNKNDIYALKKFCAEQLGTVETRHGDREHGMFHGTIWVIGEKEVLEKIDDKEIYYGASFGYLINKVINNNHSIVMLTDHYFTSNVLPDRWDINANKKVFKVMGISESNLCSYTHNDELEKAVDKLENYIEEYGANIKNMEIDTIIARINQLGSVKVLKK